MEENKNNEFSVAELMEDLVGDDSWEPDPQVREELVYGLFTTIMFS